MAQGGTEKHVLTLMRGQRALHRVQLLAPPGPLQSEFIKLGTGCYEFPEIRGDVLGKIRIFQRRLRKIDERGRIDIVHVHAAHELVKFARSVLPETPIIFHLSAHQGTALSRRFNYWLSARISRKHADRLIAVSEEEERKVAAAGFPPERVRVIYNGYEPSEKDDLDRIAALKARHGLEESLVVGNVGRLHKTKRLDLLIDAFAGARGRFGQPVKLLFIGDGPDRQRLEKHAERSGFGSDVRFAGFIPRGDRVLRALDVFVLPTSYEGCSNVLVEAMSKGLPIITTDIPSVRWMFEHGKNALLFRAGDAGDLRSKLVQVVQNPDVREELGRQAGLNFSDRFTARMMIEKTEALYQELLKKDGSDGGAAQPLTSGEPFSR
jgi:glycosyltransferase involved in cell wall biosynthesis